MSIRTVILAAAFVAAAPPLAIAAGGDDTTPPACASGQVWDKATQKCVKQTGALDTDSLYETGRSLAMNERYGEAIAVLSLAADRGDPRVLNYLGYSHRKQGRVLVGLGYYQEALKVDPDYTLVREYMGEAFLQMGDLKSAEGQLAEIEKRCGKGCAEYAELETMIEAYRKGERSL